METIPNILRGGMFMLPQLVVVVACIWLMVKKPATDSTLMTIGSFIGLLSGMFNSIILPILWSLRSSGTESYLSMITIISIVGFVGHVLFAIGLLLLIIKRVRSK